MYKLRLPNYPEPIIKAKRNEQADVVKKQASQPTNKHARAARESSKLSEQAELVKKPASQPN